MTIRSCIKSMRLRTLPLSLAGIVLGIFIASTSCRPNFPAVVFLILTTCLLQILSNLSNELGDTLAGTDTEKRQGIHYSIMDGEMTIPEMKRLIVCIIILSCVCGILMIHYSFGSLFCIESALFILLGALTIVAAMKYTLGKSPYGYKGLGDLFVFIFFGLVTTMGACLLCSRDFGIMPKSVIPACVIGCLSVGVLNVNNIRDIKTDAATRVTVALKLGERRAKIYQTALIASAWVLLIADALLSGWSWWFIMALPLFILHLRGVWTRSGKDLDPMLPLLVFGTFILSVLAGISIL